MNARTKFLFDADFGPGAAIDPAKRTVPLTVHEAVLAEARASAYAEGFAAAKAEAAGQDRQRAATALERIAAGIEELQRGLTGIAGRLEAEAVDVAVAVAAKLAPALIAREPFAEIAALARECFTHVVTAPHVVVRVNDALHAQAREQLEETARMRGFAGRLVVLAEPDIAPGDCRIEWADGGIVRDRAASEALISEAVARYTASCRAAAAS